MTNFEIQNYYQNESRFNGVYPCNNFSKKIKDETYLINLDNYANAGTQWIALYIIDNDAIHFDSFGVEEIPKEMSQQIFLEYKHIVQSCVVAFVLDLLTICINLKI